MLNISSQQKNISRKNLTDPEIYELQSQAKYLRQTLVFMCFLASIDKITILGGGLGARL